MSRNQPDTSDVNTVVMGLWALGGAVMRGMHDWTDPKTGHFTLWRAATGLVTAAVIGEIAVAMAIYMNIDIRLDGALAAVLGYIGPATTIGLITKRFESKLEVPKNDASGKDV